MQKKNFYRRKRIDAFLSEIHGFPLTVVMASTGYGKTTAVRQYLASESIDGIFINIHSADEEALWEAFCAGFGKESPELALSLRAIGLPTGDLDIAKVVAAIKQHGSFPMYLVVDDCQILDRACPFFTLISILVFEEIEGLHLILISQTMPPIKVGTLQSKGLCLVIDREVLAFTPKETAGYLVMRGLNLTTELVSDIQVNSGGWISILYCICEGFRRGATNYQMKSINNLFEENFLAKFDAASRDMLIRLSVLQEFTADLAVVATGNECIKAVLHPMERENAFLSKDDRGVYRFHALLKEYLSKQCPEDAMQRSLYLRTAYWYTEQGAYAIALEYFLKGQSPVSFFKVIDIPDFHWRVRLDREQLYQAVRGLPEEDWIRYPHAMIYTAFPLISYGRGDYVRLGVKIVHTIEAYCREHTVAGGNRMVGDCILIQTFLGIYPDDDWNAHMEEARTWLADEGSTIFHASNPITFGMPLFIFLEYRHPGSLDKVIEEDMHCPLEWIVPGLGHGMDLLIQAEGALLRCQTKDADFFARKAIVSAQEAKQLFFEISALFVLLRLALLDGDYIRAFSEMQRIRGVVELISQEDNEMHRRHMGQRAYALIEGWVYAQIGQIERIPEVFLGRSVQDHAFNGTMGLYNCIRGNCASLMENYAVAIAEYEEVLALWQQDVQHSQFIRLETLVRLAVVQRHLLMTEDARRNFTTALREAAMDDVLLPFVEDARHVLPLLLEVRKRDGVPEEFLARVIASCREQKEKAVNFVVPERERPLTSREHEILKLASEGLTQKQIAEKLDIKVVTVKKHLISVYAKMGVSGKVAAIRLARVRKIL